MCIFIVPLVNIFQILVIYMKKFAGLIFICFIVLLISSAVAKNKEVKTPDFIISPYFKYLTASSHFDTEGKLNAFREYIQGIDSNAQRTFEYRKYTVGIRADYAPSSNLTVFADLPFSFHTLNEKESYRYYGEDSVSFNTVKKDLPSHSLSQADYLAIGVKYLLFKGLAFAYLHLEGRIPPGFHNGTTNDPDYDFLSDGAFEALAGTTFGIELKKIYLGTTVNYNWRDEDLKPQLLIHTKAALRTVPGTELSVSTYIAQSLSSFDNVQQFDPRKTTLQENYVNLGFAFWVLLSDNFYAETSYRVTLDGKNTASNGLLLMTAGISF